MDISMLKSPKIEEKTTLHSPPLLHLTCNHLSIIYYDVEWTQNVSNDINSFNLVEMDGHYKHNINKIIKFREYIFTNNN